MLISAHKEDLLKEIEHQLVLGLDGLTDEDKFLLECNFDELVSLNSKHQEYLLASCHTGGTGGVLITHTGGRVRA
jgi:hypothetical protein